MCIYLAEIHVDTENFYLDGVVKLNAGAAGTISCLTTTDMLMTSFRVPPIMKVCDKVVKSIKVVQDT